MSTHAKLLLIGIVFGVPAGVQLDQLVNAIGRFLALWMVVSSGCAR